LDRVVDRDSLKVLLGQGLSLEAIAARFGKHPSTVGYWVQKHGLEAVNKERHAARGAVPLDQLATMIDQGFSLRRIARELDRSLASVRHWVRVYELATPRMRNIERARAAREAGSGRTTLHCDVHGVSEFRADRTGRYRCVQCASAQVSRRRRRVKQILLEEAGGRCMLCGYDEYAGALEFHHVRPADKAFTISQNGVTRSIESAREEARKCVVLCANCHAEVEGGVKTVPPVTEDPA
jgi:transposase